MREAIRLVNVRKTFRLTKERMVFPLYRKRTSRKFPALQDISLRIEKGECFGILGPNGSGKTTLLKIISGLIEPTAGSVSIDGRLISFLDIESGFNEDLTGEDNIFFYGSIIGMRRSELQRKKAGILEFAGLTDFKDVVLREFSGGMRLRLGLAIALASEPDIMVIDEILSAGDKEFQARSRKRVKDMLSQGVTVVLVSHDLYLLDSLCDRSVLINQGKAMLIGKTNKVITQYLDMVEKKVIECETDEHDLLFRASLIFQQYWKSNDPAAVDISQKVLALNKLNKKTAHEHLLIVKEALKILLKAEYHDRYSKDLTLAYRLLGTTPDIIVDFKEILPMIMRNTEDRRLAHECLSSFFDLVKRSGHYDENEAKDLCRGVLFICIMTINRRIYQSHMEGREGAGLKDMARDIAKMAMSLNTDIPHKEIKISKVVLQDKEGKESQVFKTGDGLVISIGYDAEKLIDNPVFGVAFHKDDGTFVSGPNTRLDGLRLGSIKGKGTIRYSIDKLSLLPGQYLVSVSCHPYDSYKPYHEIDRGYFFEVVADADAEFGIARMGGAWKTW